MNIIQKALLDANLIEEKDIIEENEKRKKHQKGNEQSLEDVFGEKFPSFYEATLMIDQKIFNGLVACERIENVEVEVDRYFSYPEERAILRILQTDDENVIKVSQGISVNIREVLHATKINDFEKAQEIYDHVMSTIQCTIKCNLYKELEDILASGEVYDYDNYEQAFQVGQKMDENIIESFSFTPRGVHTLEDAEKWVLQNHPEMYIGYSASNNIGDFLMSAMITYHPKGTWETRENRERTAIKRAAQLGIHVGEFNYHESEMDNIDM